MKHSGKIGEEIHVIKRVLTGDAGVFQKPTLMETDLRDRRFHLDAGVPSTPWRSMKSAPVRTSMRECGVNDMRFRNSIQQFAGANPDASSLLGDLALVSCRIEFT